MKRRTLYILLVFLMVFISGCTNPNDDISNLNDAKPIITTTLFPQYDFSKIIVGDKFDVVLLLPPGVEAHSFDLSPKDMTTILSSDIFIYTSLVMEPWVKNILESLEAEEILAIDLSTEIELKNFEYEDHDHDHENENEHKHEESGYDPHYWTDPMNAIIMVDEILKAVISIDKENEQFYIENAQKLKSDLIKLDEDIRYVVENSESKTIISGGHFALGYFANRYGLEYISPYDGFSPNAEPSAQAIANIIKTVKDTNAKAIFYEELVDPKVSKTISDQTGVQMLELNAAHNVSKEQLEKNVHYIDIMYNNLENLKKGLGYNG